MNDRDLCGTFWPQRAEKSRGQAPLEFSGSGGFRRRRACASVYAPTIETTLETLLDKMNIKIEMHAERERERENVAVEVVSPSSLESTLREAPRSPRPR